MTIVPDDISLDLGALRTAYDRGTLTPTTVVDVVLRRIAAQGDDGVWISRVPDEQAMERAEELEGLDEEARRRSTLYGIPFAVKDCIDVAAMQTTAACPAFAYTAERSATVVERLLAAGAILIGKTNLDQFQSGLVGTRTPYGIARNPFNSRYIPGGSSSGSAVSVAAGLVSFALGTDVAGSGRVPAAFNNVIGLKPSRGLISAARCVPAARSLDCISIFSLTAEDALAVLRVAAAPDPLYPFSACSATRGTKGSRSIPFRGAGLRGSGVLWQCRVAGDLRRRGGKIACDGRRSGGDRICSLPIGLRIAVWRTPGRRTPRGYPHLRCRTF